MKRIQPALIIGTGGSGIEVLRRFKRRFREIHPDTPYVQLLGIDTAPQEQLDRVAPMLADDEFLYTSDFIMDFFVGPDYIDRHPEIRHWWRGYDSLPLRRIKSGAGQKRPVGRLALFVRRAELVARLKNQIGKIFNSQVFTALPNEYRRSINLYVVSSTCGGTGTGQFLDLAYIARRAIEEVRPGISVHSRGLLFLPSAFLDTQQVAPTNGPRLRANALGALTELDYLMHPEIEPDDIDYGNGFTVSRDDPPFRSVYLVGNQTTDGRLYRDFHEIMERAAVHVMIELASPLTTTGDARMDNVLSAVLSKGALNGRGRSYSSFGGEWLELPTARLRVRWQKRLARTILDRLSGAGEERSDRGAGLDDSGPFGRLRALWTASGLNSYMPKVDTERSIFTDIGEEGLETSEILQNANALEATASRQLDAVEPELRTEVEEGAEGVQEELRTEAVRILREGNVEALRALLRGVDEELRKWMTEARRRAVGGGAGAWVNELGGHLSEVKSGLIGGKKKVASAQREIVLEAEGNAKEEWRLRLKGVLGEALQEELPSLLHMVREMQERVERVATYIEPVKTLVAQRHEPTLADGARLGALSDSEIDEAFEDGDRAERLQREAAGQLEELLELSTVSVEALEEVVWRVCGVAVMKLSDEYLKNVTIPSEQVTDRLGELYPLAVYEPSWEANPAQNEVERLRFLGLPEASMDQEPEIASKLPARIRSETEFVGHADPDRVVMTVQDHGFPLFALAEAGKLHLAFDDLSSSEKNLCFVLPEQEARNWSFLPEGAAESKKLFGLAFVLGLIKKVGPRLVFNSGGSGAVDTVLGEAQDPAQGLQNALDEFLAGGYSTEVKATLREAEEADTTDLHTRCREWVEGHRGRESAPDYPEVMRDIVDRVEKYTESIRPF